MKLVKQVKRTFYLGHAALKSILVFWSVCFLQRDLLVGISLSQPNMAEDTLKTCKHTHIHMKKTSGGSGRCWRTIRFIVETWRPACSGRLCHTDRQFWTIYQPGTSTHCCSKICCTSIRVRKSPTPH